jgi:hypothetical protein
MFICQMFPYKSKKQVIHLLSILKNLLFKQVNSLHKAKPSKSFLL